MTRLLSACMVLLLVLPVSAQVSIEVPLKIKEHEPIILRSGISVPTGSSSLQNWSINKPARGRERTLLLETQYDSDGSIIGITSEDVFNVWAPVGSYEIVHRVTIVNWDAHTIVEREEVFVLQVTSTAPSPGPDPSPDPDIPEDEFDNLGRRISVWADELGVDKRAATSKVYTEVGNRLSGAQSPIIPTVDLAVNFIQTENKRIGWGRKYEWEELFDKINAVWSDKVTDRDSAAKFFLVVGLGLQE